MAKADVLQRVDDLSVSQADQTAAGKLYDEAVFDLGRQDWLTNVAVLFSSNGVGTYTPPSQAIRILGIFFEDTFMSSVGIRELDSINRGWRDELGFPIAMVVDRETGKDFRLYPKPDVTTPAGSGSQQLGLMTLGEGQLGGLVPLDGSFPSYGISIFYTEKREDVLSYMELPVALAVLVREFSRESDHKDATFAGLCIEMAAHLFSMIG